MRSPFVRPAALLAVILFALPLGAPGADNPLLQPSPLLFGYPPFDQIKDEHFAPAFAQGMTEQLAEIDAIARNPAPPTFDNTLVALERSGALYDRVNRIFSSDNPILRLGRDLGMGVVNALPGLRRDFMRQAAGLTGELPKLLQGRPV